MGGQEPHLGALCSSGLTLSASLMPSMLTGERAVMLHMAVRPFRPVLRRGSSEKSTCGAVTHTNDLVRGFPQK